MQPGNVSPSCAQQTVARQPAAFKRTYGCSRAKGSDEPQGYVTNRDPQRRRTPCHSAAQGCRPWSWKRSQTGTLAPEMLARSKNNLPNPLTPPFPPPPRLQMRHPNYTVEAGMLQTGQLYLNILPMQPSYNLPCNRTCTNLANQIKRNNWFKPGMFLQCVCCPSRCSPAKI